MIAFIPVFKFSFSSKSLIEVSARAADTRTGLEVSLETCYFNFR